MEDGRYVETTHSPTFSQISGEQLAEFVQTNASMTSPEWARTVRVFAQSLKNA